MAASTAITALSSAPSDAEPCDDRAISCAVSMATGASLTDDWRTFRPLALQHGYSYGRGGFDENGLTWADATYAGLSEMSDGGVIFLYRFNYARAISDEHSAVRDNIDQVTVLERILLERGFRVPAGHLSAEQLRANHL